MSLFKEWKDLIENQNDSTIDAFWKEYADTESRIYRDILSGDMSVSGSVGELVEKYKADPVIFMGFLDGAQQSIKDPFELDDIDESSDVKLVFEPEKLYFNMLKADAKHLYGLPEWSSVLSEEKRKEITKEFRKSGTVIRTEAKIGRNDPCPCGSGKKYKHCCGRNN